MRAPPRWAPARSRRTRSSATRRCAWRSNRRAWPSHRRATRREAAWSRSASQPIRIPRPQRIRSAVRSIPRPGPAQPEPWRASATRSCTTIPPAAGLVPASWNSRPALRTGAWVRTSRMALSWLPSRPSSVLARHDAFQCGDALTKFGPGAPQPRRHRTARNLEHVGDLRHVHLFELVEHKHDAQAFIHPIEHTIQKLPHALLIGQLFRRGECFVTFRCLFREHLASARHRAPRVRRQVQRYLEEEALLRARPHVIEAPRRRDEGALNLVVDLRVGRTGVAQHARDEVDVAIDHAAP